MNKSRLVRIATAADEISIGSIFSMDGAFDRKYVVVEGRALKGSELTGLKCRFRYSPSRAIKRCYRYVRPEANDMTASEGVELTLCYLGKFQSRSERVKLSKRLSFTMTRVYVIDGALYSDSCYVHTPIKRDSVLGTAVDNRLRSAATNTVKFVECHNRVLKDYKV